MPNIQITYDEERLAALKIFLEEKGKTLDAEIASMLDALYERTVPQKVQFFLEKKGRADNAKTKAKADFKPMGEVSRLGTDVNAPRKEKRLGAVFEASVEEGEPRTDASEPPTNMTLCSRQARGLEKQEKWVALSSTTQLTADGSADRIHESFGGIGE